jgi:hypothetical protein
VVNCGLRAIRTTPSPKRLAHSGLFHGGLGRRPLRQHPAAAPRLRSGAGSGAGSHGGWAPWLSRVPRTSPPSEANGTIAKP